MSAIKLSAVSKIYENGLLFKALDSIDLEVQKGEFLAIMGPSGSGKTTLLSVIGGLEPPTEGSIEILDKKIDSLSERALAGFRNEHIGFIFQSFNLIPQLTVLDNVALPAEFGTLRASSKKAYLKAERAIRQVGLDDRAHYYPSRLSGGEQQRVAIARALVNNPDIILADEPTGNLDRRNGELVLSLLLDLNREEKRTVILVTHDPNVAGHATRKVRLLDGKIAGGQGVKGSEVPSLHI